MPIPVETRSATPDEAAFLSDLALRSKAYWGYSPEFIEACRKELTFQSNQIRSEKFDFVVTENEEMIVGFYALEALSGSEFELLALFVEPKYIGTGRGRCLIQDAVRNVTRKGGKKLLIQGDPNAEQFYTAAGGQHIGSRESGSIPGRFLPLFEIPIHC